MGKIDAYVRAIRKYRQSLIELSSSNVNSGRFYFGIDEERTKEPPESIQKLIGDIDYIEFASSYDGSVSHQIEEYIKLTDLVISPRFDEKYFYLRSNPNHRSGRSNARFQLSAECAIRNKRFIQDSYSWNNLIYIDHIHLLPQEVINQFITIKQKPTALQCHFFSLTPANQTSWKYFLSPEKLVELLLEKDKSKKFFRSENIEFLAVKPICNYRESIEFSRGDLPLDSAINKEKSERRKRVVVVFCDSLDKRLLTSNVASKIMPNLFNLSKSSVLFNNFFSSASWTYPVLHSLYKGISPIVSQSLTRKLWLNNFNCCPVIETENENKRFERRLSELMFEQLKIQDKKNLVKLLTEKNIDVFGLKSSNNHSWQHGFSAYYTSSLEKSGYNLKASLLEIDPILNMTLNDQLIFIDVDHVHRHTLPRHNFPIKGASPKYDDLNFLSSMIHQSKKLTGSLKVNDDLLYLTIRKYIEADQAIGQIISYFGPNTDFLIFSDHGSVIVPHLIRESTELIDSQTKDSTVPVCHISNPSLLYYNSINPLQDSNAGHKSNELISTQDLYQVLLKLMGHKQSNQQLNPLQGLMSSTLPKFFGGEGRKTALSTGYMYNETKTIGQIELLIKSQEDDYKYRNICFQDKVKGGMLDPQYIVELIINNIVNS